MKENEVTLYGASDDCICFSGSIRDEAYLSDGGNAVAFSDGTMALIDYGSGGLWKITVVKKGSAEIEKTEATDPDGPDYSDRLTLRGDISWAVVGVRMRAKGGSGE